MAKYTKKYLYIYATQALSMVLGMLSLFVVIPYLSSNKEVYGIYAICSSLTIFFSYADIGFVTSGQKFASEAYIQNNKRRELEIVGFSTLILLSFLCLISAGIMILAYEPSLLINGVSDTNSIIARSLLLILACSSPILCFQRIAQTIYAVRLADYIFHLLQIAGSIIKLLSVFYFFGRGSYDIVSYYFTLQVINFLVVAVSFVLLKKKYGFDIKGLFLNIKYKKETYLLLKGLAFASLFGTVCWILYYELDNIVISRLLGAEAVAVFAIAFSVLSMFRGIFGSLYSPYTTRFNYFVGLNDFRGLNDYTKRIMAFFAPICIVPIIVMSIVAKPFVFSWVGSAYDESVMVMASLMFCNILAFVSYPSVIYITALQKNKYLYISSTIIVVIYWVGFFLSYRNLGVLSFAIMKSLAMIMSAFYSFYIVFMLMKESALKYLMKLMRYCLIPILLCIIIVRAVLPYMSYDHHKMALLYNICVIVAVSLLSFLGFIVFNHPFRAECFRIISQLNDQHSKK